MKLIRGFRNLRQAGSALTVAIGAFDGLHLGHQALIRRAREAAAQSPKSATMLLTFEPTPREYFAPQDPPSRLTNFRERWRLLERIGGIDILGVLRFEESLRAMTGEAFARWLAKDLGACRAVVGHDFKFGRGGAATAQMLLESGARLGFAVDVIEPVTVREARVSSSAIREALGQGDFASAAAALGRPYSMIGRVIEGEKLGRKLGFATANLPLKRLKSPVQGVFAVRVRGVSEEEFTGVASLGTRPTVGGNGMLLEVHLFDFSGDIYGREIEVQFVAKLRDEVHFASLEELVAQMQRDAFEARRVLLD